MVTFNHLDAGTSEDVWRQSDVTGNLPLLDDQAIDALLVVAAHPDDESLGAAGLVARCAARGIPVSVLVLTDGEGSHPDSPTWSSTALATVRRAELVTAVGEVAPRAGVRFLGLTDGGLREQADVVRREIERMIDTSLHPTIAAPWSGDGHRDHRIAGQCARDVAERLGLDLVEYPVWFWHWGRLDGDELPWGRARQLRLTDQEQQMKARALAAHTTQTAPLSAADGDEAMLSPQMLAHFQRDWETFVVTPAPAPAPVGEGEGAASLGEAFFDDFYDGRADPWGFQTRWYEERKRAITLAALPRARFAAGLEVGCSTGVLTAELAERCDRLLGIDIAAAPLEAARARAPRSVTFEQMATPARWPAGSFDLVVLSEVGYYCSAQDLDLMITQAIGSLTPDGVLLACHWRHPVAEYPLGGDVVHAIIAARPELARTVRHEEEDFLLEVFTRPPGRSVATETGLR
ncbi:PIG-L family deacetylase [Sanguibacter suarezii]|uniref:PIG-L family deacetylase n=1 Tax=Sanguibacter suarezii TaxID=60921 RepID=UPI000835AF00|nr:PIG-L family deacetylase [Sanguibacter suarezii]